MKLNLLSLSLVIAIASGCTANKSSAPIPIPSGTFTGQFRKVHTSAKTGKRDTLFANLQLLLNTTTGFQVTGDTATVHAGSKGGYAISASFIQFNDTTYPASGIPTKVHLSGTYAYYYDGTVFQMVSNSLIDTLSFQYDLKKISN